MKRPLERQTKIVADRAADLIKNDRQKAAVELITRFFKKYRNRVYIKVMKKFAITCRKTYGIDVPTIRAIAKCLSRSVLTGDAGLSILKELWVTHFFENKMLAGMLLYPAAESHIHRYQGNFHGIIDFLDKIIPDFENWAVCDTLCTSGFDRLVSKYPDEFFPALFKWSKQKNIWKKRVPAATIAGYCSAKNFDVKKSLQLLSNLIGIEEKYVFKAVTWAFRNISKRNPGDVFLYLKGLLNRADNPVIKSTISQSSQKLPAHLRKKLLKIT
ncbi:MAG: DNA alkylation repair protein [Elusimicrobiota bacterium]